jgi:hypothetical protein
MNSYLRFITGITVLAVVGIATPSLSSLSYSYAFDFGTETCIADASSAFIDGYHGAHEDYYTVIGMFKDHKFPTLQAAEQSIYNETSGAVTLNHYRFDPLTGEKINITDYTRDYVSGYREGWKDAKDGKYYIDC